MSVAISAPTVSTAEAPGVYVFPFTGYTVVQGTWSVQVNTGGIMCGFIQNNTTADADAVSWDVYLTAGDYAVQLLHLRSTNSGIIKLDLDTTNILTQDAYAAGGTDFNNISEDTFTITTSGFYTLKLKVDGKNAGSSDYYCMVQAIILRRVP